MMTHDVRRICRELRATGKSLDSIARTVSLPVHDVRRAVA